MARFGTWKPLAADWASQTKMTTPDIVCLHTIVGTVAGTDAMWRKTGYSGNHSHFGVAGDGTCTQWQDTAYRAAANYNGNHRIISVECADLDSSFAKWNTNDGSAVPAFTAAQCETLAQLIAAMCKAHNIPCVLIPDAKPGRRGIGWHRLGVPGYMVAGAEQWSTAQGKVCPGSRRIAQIPAIVARAQQILSPAPTPPEDDMPSPEEIANAVWSVPLHSAGDPRGDWGGRDRLASVDATSQKILATVQSQTAALNALSGLVAQQNGLTIGDVQRVVEAAIAKGVDVSVSVNGA